MKPRLILFIVFLLALIGWGFNKFFFRNAHIDKEESEIKAILESIYASEMIYYKEHQTFTSDSGALERVRTKRPALVGILPDCKNTSGSVIHLFLGPQNSTFEEQARKTLALEIIKGQCNSLDSGFTAFAAQNLDEDDELELWSVDETGQYTNLVED